MTMCNDHENGPMDKWAAVIVVCSVACFLVGFAVKVAYAQHWI